MRADQIVAAGRGLLSPAVAKDRIAAPAAISSSPPAMRTRAAGGQFGLPAADVRTAMSVSWASSASCATGVGSDRFADFCVFAAG